MPWPPMPERYTEERWLERRCRKCGEWWPLTEEFFQAVPACREGFASTCLACSRERKNDAAARQRELARHVIRDRRQLCAAADAMNDLVARTSSPAAPRVKT